MKIISKITLIFLLVFSTSQLMAQLSIGGRVGANFANVNIKSEGIEISPSSITGFLIAVPFDIAISENFSVQPELMFIQKGYEVSFDFLGTTVNRKRSNQLPRCTHFSKIHLCEWRNGKSLSCWWYRTGICHERKYRN